MAEQVRRPAPAGQTLQRRPAPRRPEEGGQPRRRPIPPQDAEGQPRRRPMPPQEEDGRPRRRPMPVDEEQQRPMQGRPQRRPMPPQRPDEDEEFEDTVPNQRPVRGRHPAPEVDEEEVPQERPQRGRRPAPDEEAPLGRGRRRPNPDEEPPQRGRRPVPDEDEEEEVPQGRPQRGRRPAPDEEVPAGRGRRRPAPQPEEVEDEDEEMEDVPQQRPQRGRRPAPDDVPQGRPQRGRRPEPQMDEGEELKGRPQKGRRPERPMEEDDGSEMGMTLGFWIKTIILCAIFPINVIYIIMNLTNRNLPEYKKNFFKAQVIMLLIGAVLMVVMSMSVLPMIKSSLGLMGFIQTPSSLGLLVLGQ